MSPWPLAQLRHIARFAYGDSLASSNRVDGPVPVYGSNGPVGSHEKANTGAPVIVIGRKGSYGQVNFSDEPVFAIDTTYFVDPSTTSHDIRWLYYALTTAGLTALGQDVGVPGLNRDLAYGQRIPLPTLAEQRSIAGYLDAETARIDALIAKKQQLIHLLEERRWRTFDELAAHSASDLVPLRRVLTFLTDGPFGSAFSSADYVDSGMGVIRLGNIGFAEFRGYELAYLPLARQPEFTRYRVRQGDLLAAALGDERNHAGRACVAPDLGPAIVKGKCFCGRVDGRVADAEYVALACSSPRAAERFRLGAQGSTRQMINLEIFKSLRIPLPTRDVQRRVVANTRDAWRTLDESLATLRRQIDLLAEHRQALITAAVTGDLDVH